MITNPNTTPMKTQNNATTTPKTTGMVANNGVKQNPSAVAKPTATAVKQPTLTPKTTPIPQTRITAGAKLPYANQAAPATVKQGTANEAPTQAAAPKAVTSPQTNSFAETPRQNGAQMNNAMPHQGKVDRNGVKFVGIETMPKTNDNATTRGYAMITQVPAKSYGVDVSNYQGTDLSPYARQGAKFAIVKLTEGTGYINPNAAGQIASAKANDMLAMGYVFAHSGGNTAEAKQEAEYGLAEAQRAGLPKGSYIAYDYEVGASGSVPANTAAIETFMQTVLQAGYLPLLYSGNAYLHAHVNVTKITNDYKSSLWVASYPTMGASYAPNWNYFPSNPGVAIWQFTDDWKGMRVDGDVTTLPLNGENSSSSTTNTAPAPSTNTGSSGNSGYKSDYHVGDQVTIDPSAKTWTNGATINHAITNGHPYTVIQVAPGDGGAVCLKDPQTGTVMGWMNDWEVSPYSVPKQNTPSQSKTASDNNKPASQPTTGSNNSGSNSSHNNQPSNGSSTQPSSSQGSSNNAQPTGGSSSTPATTTPSNSTNGSSTTSAADDKRKPMTQPTANRPSTSADDPTTTQTAETSEQAPTTTKLPDININVAANAQAKAKAKANANINVKTNSNATGKEQAKACGLGNVVPAQIICDDSCGGSAVEEQTTPVATASLGTVETVGGYQATSPATTTVTMPQAVSAMPAQGQGSIAMPATGQKSSSVLTDLAAVAVTMLGGSMLLKKRNA